MSWGRRERVAKEDEEGGNPTISKAKTPPRK